MVKELVWRTLKYLSRTTRLGRGGSCGSRVKFFHLSMLGADSISLAEFKSQGGMNMSQIVLKWAKLRFVNHWNDFFGRWEPANQVQLFSEIELRPLPLVHHHYR